MRKDFTGVVQGVSGKMRFLVRFQDGCKKKMSLNQLTIVVVENIPEEKEPDISEIAKIHEEKIELDNGYYCCVYVILWFLK